MLRNPWEIDWNDPQQAQRPLIQRPREAPVQTPAQATVDQYQAQRAPYEAQRAQAEAERARIETETLARRAAVGPAAQANETQGQAAGFYRRALDANHGFGPGVEPRGVIGQALVDIAPESVTRRMSSPERRHAEDYARDFVAATLRRESGAAISPQEYQNQYSRYFPMPGDDPQDIAIKARLRENAIEALRLQAGELAGPATPPPHPTGTPPALGEQLDRHQQRAMAPGRGTPAELSTTERTVNDPALAGLNAAVGQMVQHRRPAGEVARYLRERGIPANEIPGLIQQYRAVQAWQRRNPSYRGPYDVRLEQHNIQLDPIASTLARGANSGPGTAAGAYLNDITGQHLDNIVNAVGGDGETVNVALNELRGRHPYWSAAGDVAAGASLYGAGRAVAGRALGRALPTATGTFSPAAVGSDAAMGAYIGSGSDGTNLLSPGGMAEGAMFSAGGGIAGRGTMNTLGRAVSPTGGAMAPLYREGVQPTIGQRMGGAADRVEQAFTSVPLIGGIQRSARNQAVDQFQRGAFNQALREIGQQLPRGIVAGRAAHKFTQRAFRQEFEGARRQMQFAPDHQFGNDLGRIQMDVDALPTNVKESFERIVRNELGGRLRRGGPLRGDSYIHAITRLEDRARAVRRRPDGQELAEALDSLVEAVDDAAARQSPAAATAQLQRARSGYARLVIIEDAARRRGGQPGEFSPTQFDAAVQNVSGGVRSRRYLAGDALMQDYADAGRGLGDTLPNSGSADRWLASGAPWMMAGMGGAGYVNPLLLSPWAASTAATLPGVRKVVNAALAPNRPGMRGLRSQLEDRAGLFGSVPAGFLAGYGTQ